MKLGVCYYPEHWPETMWSDDAARMKALGLTTVRIGEFAWSRLEPVPGQYDWGWLDRAVDILASAGLQIIMGTPTATPPKWLIETHPDILPCDSQGRPRHFGSRRHYSFSSQTYRRQSARIVAAMAERYGSHPAIMMWQTDNEYGCHDTVESNDPDARAAFRIWLRERYQDIEALNQAWGCVFWSQDYRVFDHIDPPLATVTEPNPAHVMDWKRFCSDQVTAYNQLQTSLLRDQIGDADITHNFMGHFTQFDHFRLGQDLDLATWDSYPLGFLETAWWDSQVKQTYLRTGHPDFAGFHHDLYRSVSGGRFGVMEQQPGPVNWAAFNPDPLPGMVKLWTMEAAAHGAELVSYFRWRQLPYAQEQMHAGLNRPDNQPDRASDEARECVQLLAELGELPETGTSKIGLVFDYQAGWAIDIQPQGQSFRYDEMCFQYYTALRQLGQNIDILSPDSNAEGYELIFIPTCPMLSAEQLDRFAASGAHLVFGPRTGSKTTHFQIPSGLAPGPVQSVLPIRIPRIESLRPGVSEGCGQLRVERWLEQVESESLTSEDGIIWQNDKATYIAGWLSSESLQSLFHGLCDTYGPDPFILPKGIRIRRRGDLLFVFNYGAPVGSYEALSTLLDQAVCLTSSKADKAAEIAVYRFV